MDFGLHRERLLALRSRLHGEMTQMADGALSDGQNKTNSTPTDMAELGSDAFAQELTLSLLGNEKEVLDQIKVALERISEGSFGTCEECGTEIPEARLEAIPYAPLCVKCTATLEREMADRVSYDT
jgi:DnaK suppressor protein